MKSKPVLSPEPNMTLERLQSLYELIGRMNSVYELDELLAFLVERALSLTGGQRGLLLLSDDTERSLQRVAVARGREIGDQDLQHALKLVSGTVIKDVLDQGEPRIIMDLQADQRYEGLTSNATLQFKKVRSVLAVPLKAEAQLVGLIYIDHPQQAVFGQNDLDFLSAFAGQAALAINRARQHQRQIDELSLLNELSRSVVQVLDLDEVLTRIVNEAIRILNVETGSVLLLDETTTELYFAVSIFEGRRVNIATRLRPGQGIAGWVVTHCQPACVSQVAQDERWFGEVESTFTTRSLLCVPLLLNGRVLGVLEVLNKKDPHGFNQRDITRLSAFAASATIALENARLFQEARQARQLRDLNDIALALSSTLDLETILNTGLDKALVMLNAQAGVIGLRDDSDQPEHLFIRVSRGLSSNFTQTLDSEGVQNTFGTPKSANTPLPPKVEPTETLRRLLTGIIDESGPETFILDASGPYPTDLAVAGIETLAAAPLITGPKAQGVLAVINPAPHPYTAEEMSLLSSLARIIGLAAQNAIHYTQMQAQASQVTYLNEVGSVLTSSLDVDRVLKVIIEGVNSLLETERTSIFLIDTDTNELVLRYTTKGDAEIRLPAPWQGIVGWVATNDQPALVNDPQSDPRHLRQIAVATGYDANSILCVPLKVEGQVIGVIEVLNKIGGQQFNHYHQVLLIELTKWAAIALRNAHLFDQRVQAYERLAAEQQRRIAAETRGAMAAVVLNMAHTMNNVIGAIRVWATNLEYAAVTTPEALLIKYSDDLRRIRSNAEEALKLISNMTDPLKEVALAPTDTHECLARAVQSCWWPDNVRLRRDYQHHIPPVQANAQRLEAVFHNLISNAIQAFTERGGTVSLHTRLNPAGQVEIVVADNGPGIPPELQERVFNPGISGKHGGLGLGLWLTESFVHQFEGEITFTTSAAQGTAFVVTLQPMPV